MNLLTNNGADLRIPRNNAARTSSCIGRATSQESRRADGRFASVLGLRLAAFVRVYYFIDFLHFMKIKEIYEIPPTTCLPDTSRRQSCQRRSIEIIR